MTRKPLYIFATLLCVVSLLSGCFHFEPVLPTQSYAEPAIETSVPTQTELPFPSEAETTLPLEPTNPLELEDLPIPMPYNPIGQYESVPGSNLYHIAPLDSDIDFFSDVTACGDMLAAISCQFNESDDEAGGSLEIMLLLFNMRTQQMVTTIDLGSDQRSVGFLPDGRLYTGSSYEGAVDVYDAEGNLIEHYSGLDGSYQVVSDSKGRLWCFSDWTLHCLYAGTDTTFEIEPSGFFPAVCEVRDNTIYYSRTSAFSEIYRYDLVTGENSLCEGLEDFWSKNSRMYRFNSISIGVINNDGHEVSFPWTGESYDTQAAAGGQYLFAGHTSDNSIISKFSPETKSSVSVDLGERTLCSVGAGFNCGFFSTCINDKSYEVYYWADLPEDWQEEPEATVVTLSEQELQNIATAQRLSKEYGLHVHGLPVKEGSSISGYLATAVDGDDWGTSYLVELETELARYPKGFFNALKNENITTIELLYCGGLATDGSENTISTAGAVTNNNSGTIYITFNIGSGGELARNMPHELLHVMEDSVAAIQPIGEEYDEENSLIFPGWASLNPEGFSYFNDYGAYEATDSNSDYISYTEEDENDVYFIDMYAKTYAKEDRARTFENMMADYDTSYFNTYPHIKEKAEYLCRWIEEHFPAMYENGMPLWEENLEKYS